MRSIDNRDDVIDSREVIERIEELESWRDDGAIAVEEHVELVSLQNLADQGEGFDDWEHGITLVRDSYFVKYTEEWAKDLYWEQFKDVTWPFNHIDWEAAAEDFQSDFTDITFDGVTYWTR